LGVSGFRFRILGIGVSGFRFQVKGFGFQVSSFRFGDFRVYGIGFWVQGGDMRGCDFTFPGAAGRVQRRLFQVGVAEYLGG